MPMKIDRRALEQALAAAGAAHHEYEQNVLGGERDAQWAGWYAAFVLGRIGDFAPPSTLTRWLENTMAEGDWAAAAATRILQELDG